MAIRRWYQADGLGAGEITVERYREDRIAKLAQLSDRLDSFFKLYVAQVGLRPSQLDNGWVKRFMSR